jgi:hypothetical protein
VDVDGAVRAAVRLPPHLRQQLALGDDRPGPLGQGQQQVELLAGQVDRPAVQDHRPRLGVEDETADDDLPVGRCRGTAAQHRSHPGVQLLGADRLDHVVVRTGIQRGHHVGVPVPGTHDDDRNRGDRPQHAQDLLTVDVGQAEVEQDDVGRLVDHRLQGRHARAHCGDCVSAVGQRSRQSGPDRRVVFDHEDAGHEGKPTLCRKDC